MNFTFCVAQCFASHSVGRRDYAVSSTYISHCVWSIQFELKIAYQAHFVIKKLRNSDWYAQNVCVCVCDLTDHWSVTHRNSIVRCLFVPFFYMAELINFKLSSFAGMWMCFIYVFPAQFAQKKIIIKLWFENRQWFDLFICDKSDLFQIAFLLYLVLNSNRSIRDEYFQHCRFNECMHIATTRKNTE